MLYTPGMGLSLSQMARHTQHLLLDLVLLTVSELSACEVWVHTF